MQPRVCKARDDTKRSESNIGRSRYSRLNAFEWRYEFPEVIDENGNYVGFDCVIGNPPYGVSIKDEYRKTIEGKFEHVPDYEIYYYFISLAYALLKDGGYMSYVIPNSWLFNLNVREYRKSLFEKWSIAELLDCTSFQIFDSATIRNTLVTFQKAVVPNGKTTYRCTRGLVEELKGKKSSAKDYFLKLSEREQEMIDNKVLIDDYLQNWSLALSATEEEKQIVRTVNSAKHRLEEFFDVSQGYIPYRLSDLTKQFGEAQAQLIMKGHLWHSSTKINNSYLMEIKGEHISKYLCSPSGVYVDYDKPVGTYVDMKYFSEPRLLVREIINPLVACYVEDPFVNDPGIIDIIRKSDNEAYSLKALWGILNSRLATFFYLNYAPKATKGSFPKLLIDDINNFPLPEYNDDTKCLFDQIENCFNQIFPQIGTPISDKNLIAQIESQIDQCVFKLYGIGSKDDIQYICNEYERQFSKP